MAMIEQLTDAEKSFLESGGADADALIAEYDGKPKEPIQEAPPKAEPVKAEPVKEEPPAVESPNKAVAAEPQVAPAEPQQEPQDDDDEPQQGREKARGPIPYQKYARETKRAAERIGDLEKKLAELNERYTRGDERLRLLSEVMQQPEQDEQDEDPEPDPNEDILAWANWSRRENARLRESMFQNTARIEASDQDSRMRDDYARDAAAFVNDHPDFGQAYNHLLNSRAAMLQSQGHSDQEIRQIIFNEERGLVERAFSAGKRPAQMIYEMARHMGWAPQPQQQPQPNGSSQPQAAPAPAPTAQKPSVTAEIQRIQQGQNAAKSLSGVGGGSQELSIEALANMSQREFEALYASKKGDIEALLGKR